MTTPGQRIKDLASGQSLVVEKVPGGGSLEARRLPTGAVQFYWRHTEGKRTSREPIGVYDSSAPPKSLAPTGRGYSIAAALERARDLAKLNRETPGGLRAERERVHAADQAARAAQEALAKHSLKNLCKDYIAWLKANGKPSHYDALNIFTNHLFDAHPELSVKAAAAVEKREIVAVVRKLTEADKATTARKLRSYLRAAYGCAVRADSDASLPSTFIAYAVTSNPVESTAAIKGTTDKNPLSPADVRKYWKALRDAEDPIGAALRLHVVTGGQRPAQLVRVKDADATQFSIRLWDTKGKRDEPREHLLPMTPKIRAELGKLPAKGFLLSTDGGTTPMHPTSLSAWSADIAERAGIANFQLKRVRSGIETMLAEAGVPKHIRGQLQSHGLGGVQDRSYDAHTYLPEKKQALTKLYALLERKPAKNVSPLQRKNG